MSGITRLPAVAGGLAAAGVVVYIAKYLGAGWNMIKILAAAFALANLKHLPGFWHVCYMEPPGPRELLADRSIAASSPRNHIPDLLATKTSSPQTPF